MFFIQVENRRSMPVLHITSSTEWLHTSFPMQNTRDEEHTSKTWRHSWARDSMNDEHCYHIINLMSWDPQSSAVVLFWKACDLIYALQQLFRHVRVDSFFIHVSDSATPSDNSVSRKSSPFRSFGRWQPDNGNGTDENAG